MNNVERLPADQPERERALDIRHSALVIAPAGSGKTTLLVSRFLKCLAVSGEPEEVVAITFTIKAAAEVRSRLIDALRAADGKPTVHKIPDDVRALAAAVLARSNERGWALLDNPNRLRALTIDALNGELAARLPLLSGLGGRLRLTEQPGGLFESAVHSLFAELEDPDLPATERDAMQTVLRWSANRLDQLAEPLSDMLAKREQWLGWLLRLLNDDFAPDDLVLGALAEIPLREMDVALDDWVRRELVETLRAASAHSEKLAWVAGLQEWPGCRHTQLETWRSLAGLIARDEGQGVLRKVMNIKNGFPPGLASTRRMNDLLKALNAHPRAREIAVACKQVLDFPRAEFPEQLRAQRLALAHVLLRLTQHLNVAFSRRGEADFTQVALAANRALSGEHGYSDLLDKSDARIRHLLVDEMQDTSESQIQLLRLLTSGWVPGDGHSLFMVGDPQQSIYAFRNAEVRLFLQQWRDGRLGDVPLERVTLTTNFRSHPALIEWFNTTFERIFPDTEDPYAGVVAYTGCKAGRPAEDARTPTIRVMPFHQDDAHGEAEALAEHAKKIWQQHGGNTSIAVLGRTRAHLHLSIAALRRAGLPVSCQDIDPLHDLPAVREYVHLARALWHPEDRLAWAVVLRSPLVGISYADLVALSQGPRPGGPRRSWPQRIREALQDATQLSTEGRQRLEHLSETLARAETDPELYGRLAARTEAVWHALGGPATVDADEWRDLQAAMAHLREAAATGEIKSLTELRRSLEGAFASPSSGAIQVMTVHKAKGLEFDHVLLVGCGRQGRSDDDAMLQYRAFESGVLLVPQPNEQLPKDDPAHALFKFMRRLQGRATEAELLRALYVACTRARESLTLFASAKSGDDGLKPAPRSFAKLLWPVIEREFTALGAAAAHPVLETATHAPRSPRLPVDYRFHADDDAWRPRERRTLRPSEAALDAEEHKQRAGDPRAQLIGTMYHDAMRRIAREGVERWADHGESRRAAMSAGFRHLGLPGPDVAAAVDRVLQLLRATLASEQGRWVLSPREWAQSEYTLAGFRDGAWVSAIIDRCFRDDDGVYWVVDYKAAADPVLPETLERYVEETAELYRPQLTTYVSLLAGLMQAPARGALFIAETGKLYPLEPGVTVPGSSALS